MYRAGADITQTFTFYSRDVGTPKDVKLTVRFKLIILIELSADIVLLAWRCDDNKTGINFYFNIRGKLTLMHVFQYS